MCTSSLNREPDTETSRRAAQIRAAIEAEHQPLLRSVAMMVAKTQRHLRWPDVLEIAAEIFHEAVQEALKHANDFDLNRSAAAWVRGIAARLLFSRRRVVSAGVLGDEAWAAALERLSILPADAAVAERLDLERALARLSRAEGQAIELRYYQGLDGVELAMALEVATPGAARVRVCRALQALRTHLTPVSEDILP